MSCGGGGKGGRKKQPADPEAGGALKGETVYKQEKKRVVRSFKEPGERAHKMSKPEGR